MRRMGWALALSIIVTSTSSFAQEPEPRNVRPQRVRSPLIGGGYTTTWDGRVFLIADQQSRCAVHVFRPEWIYVQEDRGGTPWFHSGAFTGPAYLDHTVAPNSGPRFTALSVIPAQGYEENPFRSDPEGRPDPTGSCETYEVVIFAQHFEAPDGDHLGRWRARLIVRDPRTRGARIEKAVMLSPFEVLRTTAGERCNGIEPTLPFDGHLLIWQGNPANDGRIGTLVYSLNRSAGAVTGWSPPRTLSSLHAEGGELLDGIAVRDRYPLAQRPLKTAEGVELAPGEPVGGAYPWVTLDGSELVFMTASKGFIDVVGRWTGWAFRNIDGPLHPDRGTSDRQFYTSPGAIPSFWRFYRDSKEKQVTIPYTAARPVLPLFGALSWDYGEVSFEDHEDGDYVLALRMNELSVRRDDGQWETDVTRTPDTSGHHHVGVLEGARFSQETFDVDEDRGYVGQGVYFTERDRVRVPRSSALEAPRRALTVELFAQRLVDLDVDAENRWLVLASAPGAWSVILEERGQVQASVVVNGELRRSGQLGRPLGVGEWAHVAFTYDGATGALRTWLRGELVGETVFGPGEVDALAGDVGLGPAADGPPASPLSMTRDPVLALDEVRVSRVARNERELARAAYRTLAPAAQAAPIAVPAGLEPRELRIPAAAPLSPERIELGRQLFFDPRLSRDRTVSCATCHDPARGYADGRPKAVGITGRELRRNTPTVINRAFSTAQFLDGRAASLEEQALAPIEDPDEMGFSVAGALARLDAMPEYRDAFRRAFGGPPTRETLARALADFQRSLLSGDAPADRFEAGVSTALDLSAIRGRVLFRGKGRCSSCHTGSTFTDEAFHATAQTDGTDEGRALVTGRAQDRGRFKTPSLRSVALTAPYLHDGSAATLADVIERYDQGGRPGQPVDADIKPLGLTPQEKRDIEAYLGALTGTTPLPGAPALPPDPPAQPRRRAVGRR